MTARAPARRKEEAPIEIASIPNQPTVPSFISTLWVRPSARSRPSGAKRKGECRLHSRARSPKLTFYDFRHHFFIRGHPLSMFANFSGFEKLPLSASPPPSVGVDVLDRGPPNRPFVICIVPSPLGWELQLTAGPVVRPFSSSLSLARTTRRISGRRARCVRACGGG